MYVFINLMMIIPFGQKLTLLHRRTGEFCGNLWSLQKFPTSVGNRLYLLITSGEARIETWGLMGGGRGLGGVLEMGSGLVSYKVCLDDVLVHALSGKNHLFSVIYGKHLLCLLSICNCYLLFSTGCSFSVSQSVYNFCCGGIKPRIKPYTLVVFLMCKLSIFSDYKFFVLC